MNIFITGISGLIGTALCKFYDQSSDHTVYGLSRNPEKARNHLPDSVEVFSELPDCPEFKLDVIINLQGAGIADKRWSEERKKLLFESRVDFTQQLVEWIGRLQVKPKLLISASAVGYYGRQGDTTVIESTSPHDEFTHRLCSAWEKAALNLKTHSQTDVAIARLGVVLSGDGGFLSKLNTPFKLGLGAKLGHGEQYLSWVHIADVVAAFDHLITNNLSGFYNVTAPKPVTNKTFTQSFASTLNRPSFLTAPAFMLKLMLGELSDLLLTGQKAVPDELSKTDFNFIYPELDKALKEIY